MIDYYFDAEIEDLTAEAMAFSAALDLIADEISYLASQSVPVTVVRVFLDWDNEVMAEFSNGDIIGTGFLETKNVEPAPVLKKRKIKKPKKPKKSKHTGSGGGGSVPGGGGGPDPSWDNVVTLLHFDADFTDNAPVPLTWIADGGTPVVNGDAPVWGDGSLYLNGSSALVTVQATNFWNFLHRGIADWTIDAWISPQATAASRMLFDDGGLSTTHRGIALWITPTGEIILRVTRATGATVLEITSAVGTIVDGETYFLRVVNTVATGVEIWVDGVSVGSDTYTSPSSGNHQYAMRIGEYGAGNSYRWKGYIDDFRVTDGTARDGAEVPTEAFPDL